MPTPITQPILSFTDFGVQRTPHEVKMWRRQNLDMLRKLGLPVMVKRRWNMTDLANGVAKRCPGCFNGTFDQGLPDCPICFGVTLVSSENDDITNLYIQRGFLSSTTTDPDDGLANLPAPKYGGFGPGYITFMIQPDVPEDVIRFNPSGQLEKTTVAQGVAPWWPTLGDNDLCFNIEVNDSMTSILEIFEAFELKMVNPITVRGFGVRSVNRHDNRIGQSFQMDRLPLGHPFYNVPLDR